MQTEEQIERTAKLLELYRPRYGDYLYSNCRNCEKKVHTRAKVIHGKACHGFQHTKDFWKYVMKNTVQDLGSQDEKDQFERDIKEVKIADRLSQEEFKGEGILSSQTISEKDSQNFKLEPEVVIRNVMDSPIEPECLTPTQLERQLLAEAMSIINLLDICSKRVHTTLQEFNSKKLRLEKLQYLIQVNTKEMDRTLAKQQELTDTLKACFEKKNLFYNQQVLLIKEMETFVKDHVLSIKYDQQIEDAANQYTKQSAAWDQFLEPWFKRDLEIQAADFRDLDGAAFIDLVADMQTTKVEDMFTYNKYGKMIFEKISEKHVVITQEMFQQLKCAANAQSNVRITRQQVAKQTKETPSFAGVDVSSSPIMGFDVVKDKQKSFGKLGASSDSVGTIVSKDKILPKVKITPNAITKGGINTLNLLKKKPVSRNKSLGQLKKKMPEKLIACFPTIRKAIAKEKKRLTNSSKAAVTARATKSSSTTPKPKNV